jgi:hypothetical protein
MFTNVNRGGVGCRFSFYYPAGLTAFVPLHELISSEYSRSTAGRFRAIHEPSEPPELVEALRLAAEAFVEE